MQGGFKILKESFVLHWGLCSPLGHFLKLNGHLMCPKRVYCTAFVPCVCWEGGQIDRFKHTNENRK